MSTNKNLLITSIFFFEVLPTYSCLQCTDHSDWLFRLAAWCTRSQTMKLRGNKQKALLILHHLHWAFQNFHIFITIWPSGTKQVNTNWSIWFICKIVSKCCFVYGLYIRNSNDEYRLLPPAGMESDYHHLTHVQNVHASWPLAVCSSTTFWPGSP